MIEVLSSGGFGGGLALGGLAEKDGGILLSYDVEAQISAPSMARQRNWPTNFSQISQERSRHQPSDRLPGRGILRAEEIAEFDRAAAHFFCWRGHGTAKRTSLISCSSLSSLAIIINFDLNRQQQLIGKRILRREGSSLVATRRLTSDEGLGSPSFGEALGK
jgi:hypothetical protein